MREESIHIVEDNEDFRGLVRIALKREGFTVREARDGREALTTLQESGSSHCLSRTSQHAPASAPVLMVPP